MLPVRGSAADRRRSARREFPPRLDRAASRACTPRSPHRPCRSIRGAVRAGTVRTPARRDRPAAASAPRPAMTAGRRPQRGSRRAYQELFHKSHEVSYSSAMPVDPELLEILAPRRPGVLQLVADLDLARRLKSARYDLAIDFHGGPRSSLLTWLSGAPVRIGYEIAGRGWMYTRRVARPRTLRPRHSVENQWDLLSVLEIRPPSPSAYPVEMPVAGAVAVSVADRL